MGSATPSLETLYAAKNDKLSYHRLTERATGAALPNIEIIDSKEHADFILDSGISPPLEDALRECFDKKQQAILLINRRGYIPVRICASCGEKQQCPRCVIPLNQHKNPPAMICHYCGYQTQLSFKCSKCSHDDYVESGLGIEKIEENLQFRFPEQSILRMDRDTTSKQGAIANILQKFRNHEADLLLGTQMVAKGHDFPSVSLVGVLDADLGLSLPDFRAQERIFQLITQVAGRSGRHGTSGKVLIQSYQPDNPLYDFAKNQNVEDFYEHEINIRESLNYPPFSKMALIEFNAEQESILLPQIRQFDTIVRPLADQVQAEVLGPSPAALKRLDNRFRMHLLIKAKAANQLRWMIQIALDQLQNQKGYPKNKIRVRVDMDPMDLL